MACDDCMYFHSDEDVCVAYTAITNPRLEVDWLPVPKL